VKQERLRAWGAFILMLTCFSVGANTSAAQAKAAAGKLSGVVRDSTGTPQMGATVEIVPEATVKAASFGLLTNTQGIFHGDRLSPGFYTVRVTLAGFLPTIQQHVRISAHLTTVVRVELESMFASLDQLRRQPSSSSVESDDWKWVLRSASVTRPVLQWNEDDSSSASPANNVLSAEVVQPRARLDFTDGARRPGSASNLPSAPATAFAYDQKLGGPSRLLLAGQPRLRFFESHRPFRPNACARGRGRANDRDRGREATDGSRRRLRAGRNRPGSAKVRSAAA